ncbi:MAG: histidine kinase [Mogibacterium sp.]|nr:histidine kinase [Mogibacterium sp.]
MLTIIIPFIMVLLCAVRIVKSRLTFTEKLVLLSYPIIPIIAAWAQHLFNQSVYVTPATFVSLVLVYTNFFHTREEELAILENQMTMSKLYSLQMQINPHMLFNTMSSIAGMCDIDPEKAQDMIFKLSDYLRDNFTDIDKPNMVTLREELEHLDHYLAIEIMRFPNITVVKDMDRDDFLIPRMTLQPLVENAIKHGICKRRRAEGTLVIKASETEDAWVVSVRDDGVGFEGKVPEGSAEEHHGIYNVRTRLSILCDGTLEVDGEPGKDTLSTVRIPKGGVVRKGAIFNKL